MKRQRPGTGQAPAGTTSCRARSGPVVQAWLLGGSQAPASPPFLALLSHGLPLLVSYEGCRDALCPQRPRPVSGCSRIPARLCLGLGRPFGRA